MRRSMKSIFVIGLSLLLLLPTGFAWAQPLSSAQAPDIVWENVDSIKVMATHSPLTSYTGPNGVTINSFSTQYATNEQLTRIYSELLNNVHGSEITYLSHIDLYPDYPYGNGIVGRWYGLWNNNKLATGRFIELYGADSLTFNEIAHTLSHEYGHHFTHYYLNLKEGTLNNLAGSGFTKLRNLSSYSADGSHEWAPEEIAAEDYAQLLGSPTWKKGLEYQDVRDVALSRNGDQARRISSLENFNVQPQENTLLPYAWDVPGLYSYWINLSGVTERKDNTPPSHPFLTLSKIEGKTLTLTWSPSTDSQTKDIRYTVLYTNSSFPEDPLGLRTTNDSKGRDAIIGSYTWGRTTYSDRILNGKTTVWVNAQDEAGNIVRSNALVLDENNLQASLSALPNRIFGSDRYATSIELSKTGWPNGSEVAILVTGNDYPDALSAAPLAKKYNAPILLTNLELDSKVDSELTRLGVKQVIIVGGTGVISQKTEEILNQKNIQTSRIYGIDRYSTAVAVAEKLGNDFSQVFIATGENFPDALSAAPIAASLGIPILLTNKNVLPESVHTFLKESQINKSYVLGGTGVISENLSFKLPNPQRISGASRYETNTALLNLFQQSINLETTYLATGSNFPDALSGSVLAALSSSPILLTDAGYTAPAQSLLNQNKASIKTYRIIGGDGALSNETIAELLN